MKLQLSEDFEPPRTQLALSPLYVLKFGSSVLRSVKDLPRVAGEIYRQRRAGRRIVAVVSALAGETDRLLDEAATVAGSSSCRGFPDLVSLGEERTAALLRIACDRIGLPTRICRPEELRLRTSGDALGAHPVRLETDDITGKIETTGVIIVPGFVGVDAEGERTLLGRGGSDFSAVFIGGELGAECVRLYKDVDGVFDRDPACDEEARRFAAISWEDALCVARPLIQPQAVQYAAAKRLPIQVEAIGSSNPTCVGPRTGAPAQVASQRALRVSIAGFGVVGQALAQRLKSEPRFEVVAILVQDTEKDRIVTPPTPLTCNIDAFAAVETDIIIDVLSCEETGALLCSRSLSQGVHVASASKRVISGHHARLRDAADKSGARLLYSAAVGGGATILETIDRARAEGRIREVAGIFNGTVNFILERLFEGLSFAAALAEAQSSGFAEEDSGADLSGADAAAKLRLVANRAMDVDPLELAITTEHLDTAAIERIQASGERWVQLAHIRREKQGVQASVSLRPLRMVKDLPEARNEWNCVLVTLDDGRVVHCVGRGAGGAPTAEAIVADLFDLADAPTLAAVRRCR